MSNYPTIRNPLLPSPPSIRRKSFSADSLRSSISTVSIRSFMNLTLSHISHASTRFGTTNNRRIMPMMPKSLTEKTIYHPNEPLVHYNGPCHTLESLPLEKLNWIKDEQASALVRNPLTDYYRSIVLRKPMIRNQPYPANKPLFKPKAMFYLRILQVISTSSSKPRIYRCGVQVNQETCVSSYATSEKTGKHSSIAQFDETFLFDIEEPTTANITIYSQAKQSLFQKAKKETVIGQETISISLYPKAKITERFVLNNNPTVGQSNDFQLLVVHGSYMSHRTQNMLNNTILFEDFITLYVQTDMVPRMDRFWGVLRGIQFELYDFEYRENRPPLYVVPLDNFIEAFESAEEEGDEIHVHLGSRGLVLQFNEKAIHRNERHWLNNELECQMYLVPESLTARREWVTQFNYVASIFDEMRHYSESESDSDHDSDHGSFDSSMSQQHEHVPLKLMW